MMSNNVSMVLFLLQNIKILDSIRLNQSLSRWHFIPNTGPDGLVVSVSHSLHGGSEFNPWLRGLFFPAYFRLSPLQKHVRKVVGGFGKKSCVSTGVRKPRNTCVTDRHDITLAVQVVLNPKTTNQPSLIRHTTIVLSKNMTFTRIFSFHHHGF